MSNLFAPVSAIAIAAEIKARRITPAKALAMGDATFNALEEKLQVYEQPAPFLTPGKGPLAGIAVGVKDIFDTNDMPTGHGSPIYKNNQPPADAAIVSMIRAAGATVVGKTVTTEFAWFTPGKTRNPHNPKHTPGGSSSGSAAGVAAGYFPAAIGSQTGGSVIRPAAFCGVAGYKPSFRLFPTVGMKHFSWSLDTVGFFAASVADAAFVAAACSHRDLMIDQTADTAPTFGIYKSSIDDLMDDDMKDVFKTIGKRIRSWGGATQAIRGPKSVENARDAHTTIQDFEARLALGDERTNSAKLLSKKLRDYLNAAQNVSPQAYDDARRTANRARKACHSLFEKCDVLLMPSAPGAAPRGLKSTGDSSFNRLWTLMGLPCVNVPGVMNSQGLPLGLQVVAPFGKDKLALQAAHWLETALARDKI